MGNNTSKTSIQVAVHTQKTDATVDDIFDPRSPTPEITRTPLQSKTGTKHNITKNVDLRKSFENDKGEEKLIHNNPILSAVIKNHLHSYDPRSPTQEFDRTPIILTSKINCSSNDKVHSDDNCGSPCLRNDEFTNFDSCVEAQESHELIVPKNLCNGFLDMTLDDTIKQTDEPFGSSTASNEAIEKNLSAEGFGKPIQLLETNFDYVHDSADKCYLNNDTADESEVSNQSMRTEKLNETEDLKYIPVFKILMDDPRSPSAGIERTPIVVAKKTEEMAEDNVEDMSDDSLIKVLQKKNTELRQSGNKLQENSEGVIIYEDASTNFNDTPKKSKSGTSTDSRTPLSCMKNKAEGGHTRSKSVNTLQDTKDNKVARRVSQIPRLKSLSKQTKTNHMGSSLSLKNISKTSVISGDCENTPPHSHRDRWDKDNSILL